MNTRPNSDEPSYHGRKFDAHYDRMALTIDMLGKRVVGRHAAWHWSLG